MSKGNGDRAPGPTPSKLGRLLAKIHAAHETERAIADSARRRRIRAQREKGGKK